MSAVTAHLTDESVTFTSKRKGLIGNLIRYKKVVAGITGAASVTVSGLDVTVGLKNTDGVNPTSTIGEVMAALSGSADFQKLATVVQVGNSGATGVAFTGSGGAFVNAISGAEGTNTVEYDDLAAATGAGWLQAGLVIERVRGQESGLPGTIERQAAITGAGLALAAGRTNYRLALKGAIGPTDY